MTYPPGVHDEDPRRLGEVKRYPAGFERHQEAFDVDVVHEVFDRGLSLSWAHGAVQHDRRDTRTSESPFDD